MKIGKPFIMNSFKTNNMDKRIFKKCKTLGEYHALTVPNLSSSESIKFYHKNKTVIDFEATMYSQIRNDRKKLGSDDKIHKI
jgi:hypothetical protein